MGAEDATGTAVAVGCGPPAATEVEGNCPVLAVLAGTYCC